MGKQWKQGQTLYSWAPKSLQRVTAAMKSKDTYSLKKSYDKPRQHIKKQRRYCANRGLSNQSYGFSSSRVWMWKFDHKEGCVLKNWYFWVVVLEKTVPWTARRSNQLILKEISPEYFIGRTDVEAETPILWPPNAKNWLTRKDPDAGNDWRWRKGDAKRMRWLDGITDLMDMSLSNLRELGSLVCCSP